MGENSKTVKRKLKNAEDPSAEPARKKSKAACNAALELDSKSSSKDLGNTTFWTESELLAEQQSLPIEVAENVIRLLEEGNTIPFIARYRRHVTNDLSPEALRDVKETYEEICTLKNKIGTVLKTLDKTKQLTDTLKRSVMGSRSIEELEFVYSPYKPGSKRTLAERAKELGLEDAAMNLLNNTQPVNLHQFVKMDVKELSKITEVEKHVIHLIASVISRDTDVLFKMRELRNQVSCAIKTKKTVKKETSKADKPSTSKSNKCQSSDQNKFDNYSDFEMSIKYIKPHQILAINRGESLKALSVKIVVPDTFLHTFTKFCSQKWISKGRYDAERNRIMNEAVLDSYNRLVQPLITREIRSELKIKAERASCDVFSNNLKHLLLAPPVKGKCILGIDPGFANGCKLAAVSPLGDLLASDVIYPHKGGGSERDKNVITKLLKECRCDFIALGNGTACRQTEEWLTRLIQNGAFKPLNVHYTIVNEEGASIYSCGAEAKKEFPNLDPNIISAVSLARRVQDPLAELVKIEPKHLGVGMYQHDLKKKQLDEALNEVVIECVSFVGVDLNTASQCLLRQVAGLSDKRATQIMQYREKNGPFVCRKQIMKVFGIGEKVFQQCAGFLRVGPLRREEASDFYKTADTTKLDCTYVHPESYPVAEKLVKKLNLKLDDLGEPHFIDTVRSKLPQLNTSQLSQELGTNEETVKLILDTFSKPLNHDLRSERSQGPLFKKGVTNISDLTVGAVLTGKIGNVTHFGCFTDVGVGVNGLIHISKMNGLNLQIGDHVEVQVLSIEIDKKRIGLKAMKKL